MLYLKHILILIFYVALFVNSVSAATTLGKIANNTGKPVEIYNRTEVDFDNAIVGYVFKSQTNNPVIDFIIRKYDEDNRSIKNKFSLLHQTMDSIDINPINLEESYENIIFGSGNYKESVLSVPIIIDFSKLQVIEIDMIKKRVLRQCELKLDHSYSQITAAFIDSSNRIYIVAKASSEPEILYYDITSGKLLKKITPYIENMFITSISDAAIVDHTLFITGLALDQKNTLFFWIGKTGIGNSIKKISTFSLDTSQTSAPRFVTSDTNLAVMNNIKSFNHKPEITLYDLDLKKLQAIDIDYFDRILDSDSVYHICKSNHLIVERLKVKSNEQINIKLCGNKRKDDKQFSLENIYNDLRVHKKVILYRLGKKYFLATNYDTVTENRRIRAGLSIIDLGIDVIVSCP